MRTGFTRATTEPRNLRQINFWEEVLETANANEMVVFETLSGGTREDIRS